MGNKNIKTKWVQSGLCHRHSSVFMRVVCNVDCFEMPTGSRQFFGERNSQVSAWVRNLTDGDYNVNMIMQEVTSCRQNICN